MEAFQAYGHALVASSILVIFGIILGTASAVHKFSRGVESGALPDPDYQNASYRLSRAFQNLVENAGFYALAVFAAILAGASPFWVNIFASAFLVFRLLVALIHIKGWGKANLGLRTFTFTAAATCNTILALLAIHAVFWG